MRDLIKFYNIEFKRQWWEASSDFNLKSSKINLLSKKKNEMKFDKIIDSIIEHINRFPEDESLIPAWRNSGYMYIDNLIEKEEFFKLGTKNKELKNGFFSSTKTFIREARNLDNKLSIDDIGQAMRNVWIINILQALFGHSIEFSKGIFGYSMLYPYTDNYLDDTKIDMKRKNDFNARFTGRLKGEKIYPINKEEERIYGLVQSIEEVFSREDFPKVYDSLLLIQEGQINSLKQQDKYTIPYERDILDISIQKGAASVIVDGYLIKGDMSKEELAFTIGYGILLQIADDIQDVEEDIKNGHMTIISQVAGKYNLDPLAIKLINFTNDLLDGSSFNSGSAEEDIKALIKDNCLMLILFSIIFNKKYFSKDFIKKVEEYLPFSLTYTDNLKGKIKKKFNILRNKSKYELMHIIDEMVKE